MDFINRATEFNKNAHHVEQMRVSQEKIKFINENFNEIKNTTKTIFSSVSTVCFWHFYSFGVFFLSSLVVCYRLN